MLLKTLPTSSLIVEQQLGVLKKTSTYITYSQIQKRVLLRAKMSLTRHQHIAKTFQTVRPKHFHHIANTLPNHRQNTVWSADVEPDYLACAQS